MVALQLLALSLLATAVWRMTRSRWAMALTPPLGVLLPWTVHQQGSFQPEALALPCLAGALVLAPRGRGSRWAGTLLAIAVGIKLPMAIPAVFGLQPDLFLPVRAHRLADVARQVVDDRQRCP
jgi:hypothetical protein